MTESFLMPTTDPYPILMRDYDVGAIVDHVMIENNDLVADCRSGDQESFRLLMIKILKIGKSVDPAVARDVLTKKLADVAQLQND